MDEFQKELLAVFREEVAEALDELAGCLTRLRDEIGDDRQALLQTAFRAAHNAKGAARTVGLELFEQLAHVIEDALAAHRDGETAPPEALLSAMLRGVAQLERLAGGDEDADAVEGMAAEITGLHRGGAAPEEASEAPPRPGRRRRPRSSRDAAGAASTGIEASSQAADAASGSAAPSDAGDAVKTATVRVELPRLDDVMAHVGELMVSQVRQQERSSRLGELAQGFRAAYRGLGREEQRLLEPFRDELERLSRDDRNELRQLGYLTEELGGAMKRMRMLPLAGLSAQWRSIVREAALEAGRGAELEVQVGDVELDKHILDALRDPIMHLLRNAVAHGVEDSATRERIGKPAHGRVRLAARTRGAVVELEVSDDGRGLDVAAIGARAVAAGMLSQEALGALPEQEVEQLVFRPGLTTAARVDRLSGRGVGLDVVRARMRELGGSIEVLGRAELGGARFRVTAPVSLVSTRHLLVEAGGMVYAVPSERVARTLRVAAAEVERVENASAVPVADGEPLRLRWLGTAMGGTRSSDGDVLRVVVVQRGAQLLGLVADGVLGVEEHVTKRLPWNLRRVPGVAGAIILGSGGLAVVTEVDYLFDGLGSEVSGRSDTLRRTEVRGRKRILVVDDSLTSRTLERNILVAAGFEVEVATDGEEAWEMLQRGPVDLVVTDVEMPRLGGFDLTRRIRQRAELRELPVILVTSLDRPEDRAAGAECGADEYIVKGHFDQRHLLEAIDRLT